MDPFDLLGTLSSTFHRPFPQKAKIGKFLKCFWTRNVECGNLQRIVIGLIFFDDVDFSRHIKNDKIDEAGISLSKRPSFCTGSLLSLSD